MAVDLFSVPVFLIILRETLETSIIVSVLLAFLKQTLDGPHQDVKVYNSLRRQVWLGTAIGFAICMVISAVIITLFYTVGKDSWGMRENYYEGAFALLASLIITVMGAALLRIGKMQQKWRLKLARALENPISSTTTTTRGWLARSLEKYAMFILPFVTVLREGVEAVVFVAGVSFQAPPSAVPLPVIAGIATGSLVGWVLYKGGSSAKLQYFLIASTCLLYLVAAGLFSRSIWHFEQQKWNEYIGGEAAELGTGPGSYDIGKSVWHVNCCSPTVPDAGPWGIFTAVLGWTNSATYGSVISYNVYWIVVMAGFVTMKFHETKGHYPFMKPKPQPAADDASVSQGEDDSTIHGEEDDVADIGDVPDDLERRVSVASF